MIAKHVMVLYKKSVTLQPDKILRHFKELTSIRQPQELSNSTAFIIQEIPLSAYDPRLISSLIHLWPEHKHIEYFSLSGEPCAAEAAAQSIVHLYKDNQTVISILNKCFDPELPKMIVKVSSQQQLAEVLEQCSELLTQAAEQKSVESLISEYGEFNEEWISRIGNHPSNMKMTKFQRIKQRISKKHFRYLERLSPNIQS